MSTLLPSQPHNFLISISADNVASQTVLESGKGKDQFLCACARHLWLISATSNCELEIVHMPGSQLVLADARSRSLTDLLMKVKAARLCQQANIVEEHVTLSLDVLDFDL